MYSRYAFALRLKTRYSYITLDFFSSYLFNFSESVMQAEVLFLSVQSCLGEIKGTISCSFLLLLLSPIKHTENQLIATTPQLVVCVTGSRAQSQ